jgi:DNA-binding transcriptional regulator YhcF (GntR family)
MNSEPSPLEDADLLPVDTVAERWGDAITAGFTPVPNALLRAQAKLGLSANDIVVLLNILMHWWHRDRLPYPRPLAIAKRSGLQIRTVQRSLRSLEEKGLITRLRTRTKVVVEENVPKEFRRARARYDLSGLREKLVTAARGDVWYRPAVVAHTPDGNRAKEQVGNPNPGT